MLNKEQELIIKKSKLTHEDYLKYKAEILEIFSKNMGLARIVLDQHGEGFASGGLLSRTLATKEMALDMGFPEAVAEYGFDYPLIVCDDNIEQILVSNLLLPEIKKEQLHMFHLFNANEWCVIKMKLFGITGKYFLKLGFSNDAEKIVNTKGFHEEVMVPEVNKIIAKLNHEAMAGSAHLVIDFPLPEYGIYLRRRVEEVGFKTIMSTDGGSLYIIVNEEEEKKYMNNLIASGDKINEKFKRETA